MENKKVRLANFSLFDDKLIATINDPTTDLELFLGLNQVSLYYYDRRFYVYALIKGKHRKCQKFDDFNEALEWARTTYHELDERLNVPFVITDDLLKNRGLANYIEKYGLTKRIIHVPTADSVGIYPEEDKFAVYLTDSGSNIACKTLCTSFEAAVATANIWYDDLCVCKEKGVQYTKV